MGEVRVPVANGGSMYGGSDLVWLPDRPTSRVAYSGAPQTIEVMGKAVLDDADHFETRQIAESVCEGLASKDYVSEYLALLNFWMQRTRYMRDPRRTELVRSPWVISQQLLAGHRPSCDCDDGSTWLAAAVLSVGGAAQFATAAFNNAWYGNQRQYSHVFTCATDPRTNVRIVLDPVAAEKTQQMISRIQAVRIWPIAA